jgi:hypothetical protein
MGVRLTTTWGNTVERRQIPKLTVGVLGGNPSGAITRMRRGDRKHFERRNARRKSGRTLEYPSFCPGSQRWHVVARRAAKEVP